MKKLLINYSKKMSDKHSDHVEPLFAGLNFLALYLVAGCLIFILKILHADLGVRLDGRSDKRVASDYRILANDRIAAQDRSIGIDRNVVADSRVTLLA